MRSENPRFGAIALYAIAVVTLAFTPCADGGQEVVLNDEPSIYWTMGTLTDDEFAIAAELGEDSNGEPLHAPLESDSGEFPTIVDSIVPTATDGALLFDAAEGQSLSIANSPFTNNVPGNPGVTNRTYEFWFQPRNLPEAGAENRQIIYEEGGTTRGLAIYLDGTQDSDPTEANLYVITTNLAEDVWGGSTGPFEIDEEFAVSVKVEKGQTYHVAFVMDKPDDIQEDLNGDLIGYLNGQEFDRVSERVGLWFNHTDLAGIGRPYADTVFHDGIVSGANASGLYFYDGILDEFAIYDGVSLTAEQIQNHYLTGLGLEESLILEFEADAERVASGQAVILSWEVQDVETLTISNEVGDVLGQTVDGKGTITVNPAETTSYTLSATSEETVQSRSVSIFVGNPVIGSFSVRGLDAIRVGGTTSLAWSVDGETSISIDPAIGDVSDKSSIDVSPAETTTYTITATNEQGTTTAEVTVSVITELVPDLGWTASDLDDGEIFEWVPKWNLTGNDGILWEGGNGGTVESGASNFANVSKWVNTPGLDLTGNPADSWQDGLGDAVTKGNVSWEMVFRPGDFDGLYTLFNTGGNGDGTAFVLTDSELDFRFQDANNDDQRVIAAVDLSQIGTAADFYHVVGVADIESDTTGTATIYVNGQLQGEAVTSFGDINDWDGGDLAELGKGNNIPGGNPFSPDEFTGDIALFSYYQGVLLTAEQVTDLYQAQSGASGSGGFAITTVQYAAGERKVTITWNSSPGRTYAVESSTTLTDAWGELADGVSAAEEGNQTSYTDTIDLNHEGASAVYYRVRAE